MDSDQAAAAPNLIAQLLINFSWWDLNLVGLRQIYAPLAEFLSRLAGCTTPEVIRSSR
jgi:hypothetical protein